MTRPMIGVYLPGCAPGYVRLEVIKDEDGYLTLTVATAESRGLLHSALVERYEGLTDGEALDVLEATAAALWPHLDVG